MRRTTAKFRIGVLLCLLFGGNLRASSNPNEPTEHGSGLNHRQTQAAGIHVEPRWTEIKPGVSRGKLATFRLTDKADAKKTRQICVYTPPNYNAKSTARYKMLTCLTGAYYTNEIPLATILDNLLAADEIWPTIAVMIDSGDARASAADLDNHASFADYVAKVLVPWVRAKWRVSTDPHDSIITGCSRGGLGATYVARKHPELFGNVLSQSGAFWRGNEGGFDEPEWLTQQFKNSPKLDLRFYMVVGALETIRTPAGPIFIEANQRLRDALLAKGYDLRYVEASGARHDPMDWRLQVADGIIYLAGKRGQRVRH